MPGKKIHGHSIGGKHSRTYVAWREMVRRCTYPRHHQFKSYGGRGITVCERWMRFPAFLEDMGEAPEGLSLDRRENSKGYDKANCRWATMKEQGRNRRNNRLITLNGETHCISEWAEMIGAQNGTIYARLRTGWDVEAALTTPVGPRFSHPKRKAV
jgi:hypothetical protein